MRFIAITEVVLQIIQSLLCVVKNYFSLYLFLIPVCWKYYE